MEASKDPYYRSYQLNRLVQQLETKAKHQTHLKIENIKQERKHHSCVQINKANMKTQKMKQFNNKMKQGDLFLKKAPQVPYLFIPKYKNETFIMPDRVFQKGEAGKRFYVKMKDTSKSSFKGTESQKIKKVLNKSEKDSIISGRKMQELNRILHEGDGRAKAKEITENIKTRRIFKPSRITSDAFSIISPMMEPKQSESIEIKKVSLNKTYAPNMWRPASRGSRLHLIENSFWATHHHNQTQNFQRVSSNRD